MSLVSILRGVELFNGLSVGEIANIASICHEQRFNKGDQIIIAGDLGNLMFVITDGFVQVSIGSGQKERVLVKLGSGQIIGEMALVDNGPRSATVKAITTPTIVQVIRHEDFDQICNKDYHIGYVVMRNLASDLSFKLRHRNLNESGPEWQSVK